MTPPVTQLCRPTHWPTQRRAHTHLVGLVNIVAVEGAQQVRQAGHVVVVDGVDDGLHHKGVFLILEQRSTTSQGCGDTWPYSSSSQDDLILWIVFITCPTPHPSLLQHQTPLSLSFISPHALTGREAAEDQNTSGYFCWANDLLTGTWTATAQLCCTSRAEEAAEGGD